MFDDMDDISDKRFDEYKEFDSGFFDGRVPDALKDLGELGGLDDDFDADGEEFFGDEDGGFGNDFEFEPLPPRNNNIINNNINSNNSNNNKNYNKSISNGNNRVPDVDNGKPWHAEQNGQNQSAKNTQQQQRDSKERSWDDFPELPSKPQKKENSIWNNEEDGSEWKSEKPDPRAESLAPTVQMLFAGVSSNAFSFPPQKSPLRPGMDMSQLEAKMLASDNDDEPPPGFGESVAVNHMSSNQVIPGQFFNSLHHAQQHQIPHQQSPSFQQQQRNPQQHQTTNPLHQQYLQQQQRLQQQQLQQQMQHRGQSNNNLSLQQQSQQYVVKSSQQQRDQQMQYQQQHEHSSSQHQREREQYGQQQHQQRDRGDQNQFRVPSQYLQQVRTIVLNKLPQNTLAELKSMSPPDQVIVINKLIETYIAKNPGVLEQLERDNGRDQQQQQHQKSRKSSDRDNRNDRDQRSQQTNNNTNTNNKISKQIHNQYVNPNPFRPKWKKEKLYMTAAEIETIFRHQDFSLQGELNYIEDFYYQKYVGRKNPDMPNLLTLEHTPIAEAFKPGPVPRIRTVTKELFDGVLGRIVGATFKGPKPSLGLLPTKDEIGKILEDLEQRIADNPYPEDDSVQYEDPLTGKQQLRSIVTQTEGLKDINKRMNITIENAMIMVLEVEDYDLLLTAFSRDDNSQRKSEIIQKRIERTNVFFEFLSIVPSPSITGNYDVTACNPYCYKEDEFFIRLLNSRKGGKFLKRLFPLLFPPQLFQLSLVIIRNLFAIVSVPTSEQEDEQLKEVFSFIVSALNGLSFTQIMVCFKDLLLMHSASRLLTRRLIKTIKTKVGIVVFFSFLMKARESVEKLNGAAQQGQKEANDILGSWQAFFQVLFSRLAGNLVSLLTSSLSNEYSNFPNSVQIWDFIIALAACSNKEQKSQICLELADIINATEKSPQLEYLTQILNQK